MKEIFKRTLIVSWIIDIAIFIFLIIEEPDAWYAAAFIAVFIMSIQFIGFGFVNPMRLFRK